MVLEMLDETGHIEATGSPEDFLADNAGDDAVTEAVAAIVAGDADEVPVGFFVLRIVRC